MKPLAAYKAAQRAIKSYRRGNDTDAEAADALVSCVSSLEAQHDDIQQCLAAVQPSWQAAKPGGGGVVMMGSDADGKAAAAVAATAAAAAAAPMAQAAEAGGVGGGSGGQLGAEEEEGKRRRLYGGAAACGVAPSGTGGLVKHSFDLSLAEEPAFLAASALLSLGLLREARGEMGPAAAAIRSALALFPSFIAAHVAAARVALGEAGSPADLDVVERHLSAAVSSAKALAAEEDGLVVESNKACANELAAGDDARRALAMLLCQSGRDAEAAALLVELGFSWRLARGVLCYPLDPAAVSELGEGASGQSGLPLVVMDDALPWPMLRQLQLAFAPSAPFWRAHGYGPRQGYFSYAFPMDAPAESSLLSQLAHHLRKLALPHFPDLAEARYAEWWAHCRRHCSGHQLHFDSDDEGIGGVRNPIMSSVVYLSSSTPPSSVASPSVQGPSPSAEQRADPEHGGRAVGGPTLVTVQRLGGELATHGWLAYPAVNRVTMFDGAVLHGVIPGRGPSPNPAARRCTLMVAFWRELRVRQELRDGQLCASMTMPSVPATSAISGDRTWLHDLAPLPREEDAAATGGQAVAPRCVVPAPVSCVWEQVVEKGKQQAPRYDVCFQGF